MNQGTACINIGFMGLYIDKNLDRKYGSEFPGSQSKAISYESESVHEK